MTAPAVSQIPFTPDPVLSFWPTPDDVADDLMMLLLQPWHCDGEDVRILEPSAGDGHLAAGIRRHLPAAHITAVEPAAERAARLAETGAADQVVHATIEDYLTTVTAAVGAGAWRPYDLVVMNPPFALPGRPEAWAEHILTLFRHPDLLRPGAQIGAVVPRIVLTGRSRLVRQVRELLDPVYGCEPCDRGAFASTGAAVSTALLWIEKPDCERAGGLW